MIGVRRPYSVGSGGFFPDGRRCRFEKLSKTLRRAGLHALERLGLAGGVLGQRFFGELGEKILGFREGRGPAPLGREFFKDEHRHGILLGCGKLRDFAEGFFKQLRHELVLSRCGSILHAGLDAV